MALLGMAIYLVGPLIAAAVGGWITVRSDRKRREMKK